MIQTMPARGGAAPSDLPAEPAQAVRFGKMRDDRAGALLEDYAELIGDLLATHG